MPQSLSKVLVHIVYSTKHRKPWLTNHQLRSELFAYQATVLKNEADSPAILINGIADHLHIFCQLSRKLPIMDVIKHSKTETTKWLKKQSSELEDFQWQSGYGIFSVSPSNVAAVRQYIADQEKHHQSMSFEDEFRELCLRHGVEMDERHVWE